MASKKKPIRVGLVGMGRAGWATHVSEFEKRPDKFVLAAACDPLAKRRALASEKYGCPVYKDVQDLIDDPNVEMMSIACRSTEHVDYALRGLKAGKIVNLEKPIALTYAQACTLRDGAATAPGTLYIRHNRRFESAFHHIQEILATGVLGDLYEVKLRRHSFNRRDDWQMLIDCGGGQLMNWGPHIIDHGLILLDSPVRDLWCDLKRIAAVGDAEDHIKVILEGENGRVVDIEISGGVAIPEPAWTLYGTRGSMVCDERTIRMKYLDPKHKLPRRRAKTGTPEFYGQAKPDDLRWIEKELPVAPETGASIENIWDALHDSIRNGAAYPVPIDEIVEVMRVITEVKKRRTRLKTQPIGGTK